MKRLKALIGILLITLLCVFAVSNLQPVRINFWGSHSLLGYSSAPVGEYGDPLDRIPREVPAYLLIFICLALGFNVILLSLVLYFSFSLKAAKRLMFSILRFVARFSNRVEKYESQIETAVEQYHGAIRRLSSRRKDLLVSLSISFVFWFTVIMRNYLVVIALGYQVDFMVIVVVQMVGTLVGVFPVFPGGLGSIDGVMVFLYYSFRFPIAVAMTASLVDRFISFWLMMIIGAVVVFYERDFLKGLY